MRECLWTDQGGQDIAEYEVMLGGGSRDCAHDGENDRKQRKHDS